MFSIDDTIVAIATPPGRGGIGVVRLSGPEAPRIAEQLLSVSAPLKPRHATYARLQHACPPGGSSEIDEVIATLFPAPKSYTGQHVVEVSAHGSPVVLGEIVRAAVVAGARVAERGEFTLRAFLSGKRDLVQVEAIADLIAAVTPLQARLAFDQLQGTLTESIGRIDASVFDLIARLEASIDFPDEGYRFVDAHATVAEIKGAREAIERLLSRSARGRLIREGAIVVIAGPTNVGKSSLFNYLCGSNRAIVADVPGTTRDLISERVDVDGIAVTLVDTAGAREAVDAVEREGMERATRARDVANLTIVVADAAAEIGPEERALLEETKGRPRLLVANKSDLVSGRTSIRVDEWIAISVRTGDGLDRLRPAISSHLGGTVAATGTREEPAITNARHIGLLERALTCLGAAEGAAAKGRSEEFVLADLQTARTMFDEVVGRRTPDDVLNRIFETFCVGK